MIGSLGPEFGSEVVESALQIFIDAFHRSGIRISERAAWERWIVYLSLCHILNPFSRQGSLLEERLRAEKFPEDYIDQLLKSYTDSLDILECVSRMKGETPGENSAEGAEGNAIISNLNADNNPI